MSWNDAAYNADTRHEQYQDEDLTAQALAEFAAGAGPTSNDYRRAARRLHEREGEIEIEEFAHVEDADGKPGVWVEAWVYVSDEDARAEDTTAQGEN